MSKTTWKPGTLLAPVPAVMVTCGTLEQPNVLTVAWTGIINTSPPMTYISIRPTRFSYEIIKKSREFVINLTTVALVSAADSCGVKSGSDTNKFAEMDIHVEPSAKLSCPILKESPLSLECKVVEIKQLGSHHMFLAEIVAVDVEDSIITSTGKLNLQKANLLAYAHGEYFELGKSLGTFGFSVRKKKLHTKRRSKNPREKQE